MSNVGIVDLKKLGNWRDSVQCRARNKKITELSSTRLSKSKLPSKCNLFSLVPKRNQIVLANIPSGSQKFFCKAFNSTTGDELWKIEQKELWSDLRTTNDFLLISTFKSITFIYKLDPNDKEPKLIDKYSELKDKDNNNDRIKTTISINPKDENQFALSQDGLIQIWSRSAISTPIYSLNSFKNQIRANQWHPIDSFLLAIAGSDGFISIIDTRSSNPSSSSSSSSSSSKSLQIWTKSKAHEETITDFKWNPFINHWFITSSEDCQLKLWDLRYDCEPLAVFRGHTNFINSVNWSKTHCELFASSSVDRTVRLWGLNQSPTYQLATIRDPFSHSVISVDFGLIDRRSVCYATSENGEVVITNMSDEFIAPIAPTRLNLFDENKRKAETLIFQRDFKVGFEKVIDQVLICKQKNQFDEAMGMIEGCFSKEIIKLPNDFDSSKDSKKQFEDELKQYTYLVPPNYDQSYLNSIDPNILSKMKELRVELQLYSWMNSHDYSHALSVQSEICEFIKKDRNAVETATIVRMLEGIASDNLAGAAQFAFRIGSIFLPNWNDESAAVLSQISFSILRPTIFDQPIDPNSELPTSQLLNDFTANPKNAFQQVELISGVLNSKHSISTEMKKIDQLIISLRFTWIVIRELTNANQFDRLISYCLKMIQLTEHYMISIEINKYLQETVSLKLEGYLENSVDESKDQPWIYDNIRESLVILLNCVSVIGELLPEYLYSILESCLTLYLKEIKSRIELIPEKFDTNSKSSPKKQQIRFAKKIYKEIKKMNKSNFSGTFEEEFDQLLELLKTTSSATDSGESADTDTETD